MGPDSRLNLVLALADDELVLGHRHAEWTGWAPYLEEDLAFSSIAQDEMAHARALYELAEPLAEGDTERLGLDNAGLDSRDGEGFRLRPDGEQLTFVVDVPSEGGDPTFAPLSELIEDYWAEVGINATMRIMDASLFTTRHEANDFDVNVWQGSTDLEEAILSPTWYMPHNSGSLFAVEWARWYTSRGSSGQEPPEPAKQQMEFYDQLLRAADDDERDSLFREILEIAKEEFYAIGTVLAVGDYGIVKDHFHNVPDPMAAAWVFPQPGPINPEQFFIG
jgi:peptide/nickel transport system substrate-binding protein